MTLTPSVSVFGFLSCLESSILFILFGLELFLCMKRLSQVLLHCCNSETIYLTRVNIYSGHNCKSIAKKKNLGRAIP